jgi:hypothetical protein
MVRARDCVPSPHHSLQSDHVPHSVTTQSTGHGCGSHALSESCRPGHATPPWAGCTAAALLRERSPPPQVWLHALHAPHAPITQSIGHSCMLHVRWSASGHSDPPCWATVLITTGLVCVPPPHDLMHGSHPAWVNWQSMGHGPWLQSATSSRFGHGVPPCALGVCTARVRALTPPPQGSEQLPYALHGDTAQFTGAGVGAGVGGTGVGVGVGADVCVSTTITVRHLATGGAWPSSHSYLRACVPAPYSCATVRNGCTPPSHA